MKLVIDFELFGCNNSPVDKYVKKMLKTFALFLYGPLFVLFCTILIKMHVRHTKKLRAYTLVCGLLKNRNLDAEWLKSYDGYYGFLLRFKEVSDTLKSFAQEIHTNHPVIHRFNDFFHREIHMYPYYRDLMILSIMAYDLDMAQYGLSPGILMCIESPWIDFINQYKEDGLLIDQYAYSDQLTDQDISDMISYDRCIKV